MINKIIFIAILFNFGFSQAQIDAGDQLTQTGNWKAAIKAYNDAPDGSTKNFKMAQAYSQLGNTFKAIEFYEIGFTRDSTSIKPRFEYGKLLINSQRYVDAIPVFELLKENQPQNASFHYFLGDAWSGLKQTDQAIKSYQQALFLNKEYRAARLDLIKNYIQKRNFEKAMLSFLKIYDLFHIKLIPYFLTDRILLNI